MKNLKFDNFLSFMALIIISGFFLVTISPIHIHCTLNIRTDRLQDLYAIGDGYGIKIGDNEKRGYDIEPNTGVVKIPDQYFKIGESVKILLIRKPTCNFQVIQTDSIFIVPINGKIDVKVGVR